MFAQMLKDEGVPVTYDPPMQRRSGVSEVVQVVYSVVETAKDGVIGGTAFALANGAVKKMQERFPKASIEVHPDSDEPQGS
jgi:hypothetical protein